ncbi:MAG: NUDIX domain-containing protein [Myxococcota bacterium]|nr:NUDIX domain-containing protein [Myxococcota bacterium]
MAYYRKKFPPDVLYYATSQSVIDQSNGCIRLSNNRRLFLSHSEAYAWQIAHRSHKKNPIVLFLDVPQAWRNGVYFYQNRQGLWQCDKIPLKHVLNLQSNFKRQLSSGGIPFRFDGDEPQMALIQVKRPHARTWELAKGKLEYGETPQMTAKREIFEEMGYEGETKILKKLRTIHFGFMGPNQTTYLKSLFIFVMEMMEPTNEFVPRGSEGIVDVQWFTLSEARRAVTHRSLFPVLNEVEQFLIGYERS